MVNIADLSKAELVRNNEKLVKELLIKQGYEFTKILGNRVQTKYKISKNNETHIIKIMGYRYNDKTSGNYAYVQKHDFDLQEYKFLFFVLYYGTNVYILKIPSTVFINPAPNSAFKNRDYEKGKSLPEYGIVINSRTINELLIYQEVSSCNHFSLCNN
ncbi:MAG: hypothetical protein J6T74_09090 [Clostridia bacterium]|nr:hypothetical protein [Clostridia bacterium]